MDLLGENCLFFILIMQESCKQQNLANVTSNMKLLKHNSIDVPKFA